MMNKIPVWLDCDTGHDDAFAILLAANHDMVELLGVSTVHGNAALKYTTWNTCAVLQAMGRQDVPVVRGEPRPLQREPCFAPEFHGESGLDGVPLLPQPDQAKLEGLEQGTSHISKAILSQPPNTVWIVATGPLTNIAKLFLDNPEVMSHIRGLSIMGGSVGEKFTDAPMHRKDGPGNWTPWAEFNIFCDPEAAHQIFSDSVLAQKTTLIPLDLTHQCRGTASVQDYLFSRKTSVLRQMMRQILTFFTATYHEHSGIEDGPPLHDPLAVYAMLCPEKFNDKDGERWNVETRLDEVEAGRTVLHKSSAGIGVRVPRTLDLASFWKDIDAALEMAEQRVATV